MIRQYSTIPLPLVLCILLGSGDWNTDYTEFCADNELLIARRRCGCFLLITRRVTWTVENELNRGRCPNYSGGELQVASAIYGSDACKDCTETRRFTVRSLKKRTFPKFSKKKCVLSRRVINLIRLLRDVNQIFTRCGMIDVNSYEECKGHSMFPSLPTSWKLGTNILWTNLKGFHFKGFLMLNICLLMLLSVAYGRTCIN